MIFERYAFVSIERSDCFVVFDEYRLIYNQEAISDDWQRYDEVEKYTKKTKGKKTNL